MKKNVFKKIAPIAAMIGTIVVLSIVLFSQPIIGMEDNGDYFRVTAGNGLYPLPENEDFRFSGYFVKEYGIMQYFNEYSNLIFTSQTPFIKLAVFFDRIFTKNDAIFDIRFLGAIFAVYCAITIYFLIDFVSYRFSLFFALLTAMICIYLFVDTGYSAYFNSFFAEGLALISFIACLTSMLLYSQGRYNKYLLLFGFVLNGMILTLAKQQFAPLGIILGLLCIFFLLKAKSNKFKILVGFCSFGLIVSGIMMYVLIPSSFVKVNKYHAMTRGILLTADDPEISLESFNINNQYALLSKSIYFERYPVVDVEGETLSDDFYDNYGFSSIVSYYLDNPGSFIEMLDLTAKNAYYIRPHLGNFEHSEQKEPNAISGFFAFHSNLKREIMPKTIGFIIIWMITAIAATYKNRLKQMVILAAILMGVSQFFVSIIGAGDADLSKHVFLYNVAFDFVNFLLLSGVIAFADKKYKLRRERKSKQRLQKAEVEV